MFTVKANFIGDFKTGDNINYNLKILNQFYELNKNLGEDERILLLKPIILIIVSIIEAVLHDFYFRIRKHTNEGVPNLGSLIIDYIRGKNFDQLSYYIESVKKHNIFNFQKIDFYEKLDQLRKLRNRIHIQNKYNYEPIDEERAFTNSEKILAERKSVGDCIKKNGT